MHEDFVLLAYCTSLHIVRDPIFHFGPPVLFLHLSEGFVSSWVSSRQMVMHEHHDSSFYFKNWWYDDSSFRSRACGCYYKLVLREYCDVLVVGFSFVGAWRA